MAEQSYNLKYTGKEIDDLLDKANDMDSSAQVPAGGTSGQVLTKKSGTDFDAQWKTPGVALPAGGTAGQILTKNSSTNGDASWKTPEAPSNPLPTGGTTGQVLAKKSDTNYDTEWIDVGTGLLNPSSNAGAHNSIYRGNYLGTSVTTEQYAAISAGTFDDLYIGDYWTIGGVNYRIAAFDYYINSGDTKFTKHHVVVVPDTYLYKAQMNTSNVTTGGYTGSAMYKSNLAQAKTTIKAAFGSAHVLTKREPLTNAVNGNTPSGWAWFDSDVELMNEVQAYGSVAWGAHDGIGYNVASCDGKFPLFMFDRTKLHNLEDYWLRDVSSSTTFSLVSNQGYANLSYASSSYGVRPAFCIG